MCSTQRLLASPQVRDKVAATLMYLALVGSVLEMVAAILLAVLVL